jgi:hypothetical protein
MENFERENSALETYRAMKNSKEAEYRENREKDEKRKNEEKEKILELLKNEGVPDEKVETNGYSFQLTYKGMSIVFVNQEDRLCGEMYKTPRTDEERKMLEEAHMMIYEDKGFAQAIKSEYYYEDFIFAGNPVRRVKNILKLAESKGLEG